MKRILPLLLVAMSLTAFAGRASADGTQGIWTPTGDMAQSRLEATATLLPDGKVLEAGGEQSAGEQIAEAELYDPATGTWMPTGSPHEGRNLATATLLPDGRVLVAGGGTQDTCCSATAELYDPLTGIWSYTGSMHDGRQGGVAAVLPDGRVLVAGGCCAISGAGSDAEIYDPTTGIWSVTGTMNLSRSESQATSLLNGKVLVVSGVVDSATTLTPTAELYDPTTGTWSLTGSLRIGRYREGLTRLADGRVLVAGGYDDLGGGYTNTAEIYDPASGTWSSTGPMTESRFALTTTLLTDGTVLAAGNGAGDIWDPDTGTWTPTGSLNTARYWQTATLLPDGQVLIAGGTTGITTLASAELYTPVQPEPPAVTAVDPARGFDAGGNVVTITGTHLSGATAVSFGTTAASSFTVASDTSITATSPAGSGTVDIQVTTPAGTSAIAPADEFTYVDPPTITDVSPATGPLSGGSPVTITGTNLSDPNWIYFGTNAASDVSCTATTCTATPPIGIAGTVDVTVSTAGGTTTPSTADRYKYTTAPVVNAVNPAAGPVFAGTQITVTGSNLAAATAVTFGAAGNGTLASCTATACTVQAPASTARTVDVRIVAPTGTSATSPADKYTFVAVPTVKTVSPAAGPLDGGTSVRITGTNLATATAITFGSTPASAPSCTATACTMTAPGGPAGTVDIQVTTAGGTSATGSTDQYTYRPAPAVTAVSPAAGPLTAGTVVTVTGTNLTGATSITFGGHTASAVSCTATTCVGKAPAGAAGTVDVNVTTPGGTSAAVTADQYTYTGAPTITAVSPTGGPAAGGTTTTITGTNLAGATEITFGTGRDATGIACTTTSCTVTSPPGAAGTVNVRVSTPGGTSAVTAADHFTFH